MYARLLRCAKCASVVIICFANNLTAQPARSVPELNTIMMESTFMIEGPAQNGQTAFGTGFLVGRPLKVDPTKSAFVLVSAKHVLESISGTTARLDFRTQRADHTWSITPVSLKIRDEAGHPLWVAHPSADVVAMYVSLPQEAANLVLVPMALLANDDDLTKIELHPGDELNCLGFPMHAQSDAGFPILRSGKIASYPLLPTKTTKTFLMDFAVFPGNSGGPVYLVSSNRVMHGATVIGVTQAIVGLVIEEEYVTETLKGRSSITENRTFLNLAKVVHASLIREIVEMLPELKP